MKILLLGNADSKWHKEFIEYVLLPLGHEVTVTIKENACRFTDFYGAHSVKMIKQFDGSRLLKKIPFVRVLSLARRTVNNNAWETYDLILYLFVNHQDLAIGRWVTDSSTKNVLYFIGSDLFRKSCLDIRINKLLLKNVSQYVVGSSGLYPEFKSKYGYKYSAEVIRFGVSVFDNIDKFIEQDSEVVSRKKARRTICIGYNGRYEQQHIKVLDALSKLPECCKRNIKLMIPMTYKFSQEYFERVDSLARSLDFDYEIKTEFMDNDDMAQMWLSTDIFINAQTTDSLSASVLEAMYAGATVISGSWLDYPEYKEFGLKYIPFSSFDSLSELVDECLSNQNLDYSSENRNILKNKLSWMAAQNNWKEMLWRIR